MTTEESTPRPVGEKNKFSFLHACGLNTMYMFGTGPLITIPYCITAVDPMGPHAMIGYGIAVLACVCDSLVWGEIGSMWPESGGSYVYLRELYGPNTWGRFAAFMFIWQFFISGPAEVASGCIAIAEYLAYFSTDTVSYDFRVLISLACISVMLVMLYRQIEDVGRATIVLWAITIFAMAFTIIAGFSDYHEGYLDVPKGAFNSASKTVWAVAGATRFGVYDMTGYYDVCNMGGEVQNPRRTIPLSCIATCCIVGVIYVLVYLAVLGAIPWQGFEALYTNDDATHIGIMSLFTEARTGSVPFAKFITVIVCLTIFGSTFAMMCGFAYIPYAAARDGYFFSFFAHKSSKHEGLANYSLLTVGLFSAFWCFFSLDLVIDAMTTMIVLVMFCGQSAGLVWYRYRTAKDEQPEGWRMPLFPLPCIIQFVIFFFIFITTESYYLWGDDTPVLDLSVGVLALGVLMFLVRSKYRSTWPFADPTKKMIKENDREALSPKNGKTVELEKQSEDVPEKSAEPAFEVVIPEAETPAVQV